MLKVLKMYNNVSIKTIYGNKYFVQSILPTEQIGVEMYIIAKLSDS